MYFAWVPKYFASIVMFFASIAMYLPKPPMLKVGVVVHMAWFSIFSGEWVLKFEMRMRTMDHDNMAKSFLVHFLFLDFFFSTPVVLLNPITTYQNGE